VVPLDQRKMPGRDVLIRIAQSHVITPGTAIDGPLAAEDQLVSKTRTKGSNNDFDNILQGFREASALHILFKGAPYWLFRISQTYANRSPNTLWMRRFYEMHHILQSKVMDHAVV
jgi:hypothetical protein